MPLGHSRDDQPSLLSPQQGCSLSSPHNLSPSPSVDVTTYVGASLVRIRFPHPVRRQVGGGRKGKVRGQSPKSQRAMMNFVNSINMERVNAPPLFITLTYPDRFPTENAIWTEHFNHRFHKRLERRFPGAAVIWRKEFKRRKTGENAGKWAPHYHLLLFVEAEPSQIYEWLSKAWYESCGRICDDHLVSGIRVRHVRSWEGAKRYVAKRPGEVGQLEQSMPSPGRSLGKWNASALPIEEQHEQLSYAQGIKLRRVVRKLTGVNPPARFRNPTNMVCYVKYATTQKVVVWLKSGADLEPGEGGTKLCSTLTGGAVPASALKV